jgi:hypothetical protein
MLLKDALNYGKMMGLLKELNIICNFTDFNLLLPGVDLEILIKRLI